MLLLLLGWGRGRAGVTAAPSASKSLWVARQSDSHSGWVGKVNRKEVNREGRLDRIRSFGRRWGKQQTGLGSGVLTCGLDGGARRVEQERGVPLSVREGRVHAEHQQNIIENVDLHT
jgi:hypothetical protein